LLSRERHANSVDREVPQFRRGDADPLLSQRENELNCLHAYAMRVRNHTTILGTLAAYVNDVDAFGWS
jgi:hypothetical protein